MEHLIDKDALVAEIEKRVKINKECMLGLRNLDYYQGKVDALNDTISFLNALEVKEVDLEKKLDYDDYVNFFNEHPDYSNADWGFDECWVFAKHFFELGLKAQKGEKV